MKQHTRRFFSWRKAEELGESLLIVVLAMTALVACRNCDRHGSCRRKPRRRRPPGRGCSCGGLEAAIKARRFGLDQATATAREY